MLMKHGTARSLLVSRLVLVVATLGCNRIPQKASDPPPVLSIVRFNNLGTIPASPNIRGRNGAYSALFQGNSVWLHKYFSDETKLARSHSDQ